MNIYFITGTNTAGKSTIVPLLQKKLSAKFVVYDFDERGIPDKVDAKWRQKETKYWLGVGARQIKKGLTAVICGLAMPEEIYKFKKTKLLRIKVILLDISAREIAKRLKKKFNTQAKLKTLKRKTQLSLADCISHTILRAKKIRSQCRQYKGQVFNTSFSPPHRIASKIADRIYFYDARN